MTYFLLLFFLFMIARLSLTFRIACIYNNCQLFFDHMVRFLDYLCIYTYLTTKMLT